MVRDAFRLLVAACTAILVVLSSFSAEAAHRTLFVTAEYPETTAVREAAVRDATKLGPKDTKVQLWHPHPLPNAVSDAIESHRLIVETLGDRLDRADRRLLIDCGDPTSRPACMAKTGQGAAETIYARWQAMLDAAKVGDVLIFYFSGHGVEIRGINYLFMRDTVFDPKDLSVLNESALSLQQLMQMFGARQADLGRLTGLFIIDACRNDPSFIETTTNGLAGPVGPVLPPRQVFVMYSAGIGQEALDEVQEGKTLYTRHLLHEIGQARDLSLAELAQTVRFKVYEEAMAIKKHVQTPAYYDQLQDNLNILGSKAQPPPTPVNNVSKIDPKGLDPGAVFIECPYCPEMVVIPSGQFMMGAGDNLKEALSSERPAHRVDVKRYAMGRYEVTNREWNQCVRDKACDALVQIDKADPKRDQYPASGMTWAQAQQFVSWLTEVVKSRRAIYRLPTEAEWEYAARGGEMIATRFSYGNRTQDDHERHLCDYANGADRSAGSLFWVNHSCDDHKSRGTTPRGSYKPNSFGLHDMRGNVWEWVQDCWHATHGDHEAVKSQKIRDAAMPWVESGVCANRVVRGGSWRSAPAMLRSTARSWFPAAYAKLTLGFRVVRELE